MRIVVIGCVALFSLVTSLACCCPMAPPANQRQQQIVQAEEPIPFEVAPPAIPSAPPPIQPKSPDPGRTPAPPAPTPAKPNRPATTWARAPREAAVIGDLSVRVRQASIGIASLSDLGRPSTSKDRVLMLTVEISNVSADRLRHFEGWGKDRIGGDRPVLRDDIRNRYPCVRFRFGTRVEGQATGTAPVQPGETVSDVIVFDRPVDRAKYLELELPADAVHQSGHFRFRIAMEDVSGSVPAMAKRALEQGAADKAQAAKQAEDRARAEEEAAKAARVIHGFDAESYFRETYGKPTKSGTVAAGKIFKNSPARWLVYGPQRVRIVLKPAEPVKLGDQVKSWHFASFTDPVTLAVIEPNEAARRLAPLAVDMNGQEATDDNPYRIPPPFRGVPTAAPKK